VAVAITQAAIAVAAAVVITLAAIAAVAAVVITPAAIAAVAAVVITRAAIAAAVAVAITPAAIAAAVATIRAITAAAAATIPEPATLALIITPVVLGTGRPGMAGTLAIIISGPSSKVGSGLASRKRARALIRIPFRQMDATVTRASSYVSEWLMWHSMMHRFSLRPAEGKISEFSHG
jgi:hypothetical protein